MQRDTRTMQREAPGAGKSYACVGGVQPLSALQHHLDAPLQPPLEEAVPLPALA